MKSFACFLFCLFSISLFAQLDDYCPCMDPPKYFENSFMDSLLYPETNTPQFYTADNEPQAVLVTDNFYEDEQPEFIAVMVDKPINISPSELPTLPPEKNVNVSPSDSEASEENPPRDMIKQKRKRKRYKVKRQRKFRKYKGKCPSF
ncbi:MAG: hypothetical protein AB8F74_09090 [Saprospiraceae bacterium]